MIKRLGYVNLSSYEDKRNADGKLLCLNCEKLITAKKRRRYCCPECSTEFLEKNSHAALRSKLIQERKGKCEHCGNIPTKKEINRGSIGDDWFKEYIHRWYSNQIIELTNEYAIVADETKLILDHKNPIALGGAEFDRANLQILCIGCDKIKTRLDKGKIAMFRKTEVPATQTKLR